MSIEMAKPLAKIKRIRSLDEFLTRGGQAISAYRDQRRGGHFPNDTEFTRSIDSSYFGKAPIIAESLWQKFFIHGRSSFFPVFQDREASVRRFRDVCGWRAADRLIDAAERISAGRIDLLGFENLYIGLDPDWHLEPISQKRSPLKHWKEFDDLDCQETGNIKVVWELNRHQHFFSLGAAYWFTRDERFAEVYARHLRSWIVENPPGMGVNWSSSLEIAIRAM